MESPLTQAVDSLTQALPSADTFAWMLLFVVVLYTLIHIAVFVYHWYQYNIAPQKFQKITYIVYFSGIAVFLAGMFFSTLAMTS